MSLLFKAFNLQYSIHPVVWILLTNLIPVFGVFLLDWSAYQVITLYWTETLIIGIFNFLKILTCSGGNVAKDMKAKMLLALFFCVHFSLFMVVQGIFIFDNLENDSAESAESNFTYSVIGLFCSYLSSFIFDYIANGKYRETSPDTQMVAPYPRIFVQQFVAIGGGFLVIAFESSRNYPILILLILLKTVVDIAIYSVSVSLNKNERLRKIVAGSQKAVVAR